MVMRCKAPFSLLRAALLALAIASGAMQFPQAAAQGTAHPGGRAAQVIAAAPDPKPASLELLVLGSGGPGATGRAGSSHIVLIDGKPRILVDAGPGSFVRLGEAHVSPAQLDIVLLTHLHADHTGELPGLVKARAVAVRDTIEFRVFGPRGHPANGAAAEFPSTSRFVSLLFGPHGAYPYLRDFAGDVSFKSTDLPAASAKASSATVQTILAQDGIEIRAIAGHHRDAPAIIYRVDRTGSGGGRSITFTGDIDPAGHAALRRIAEGTDLLVFNCVVLDPPDSPAQLYELHTAPRDIGRIAESAHARRVLLAHISPAVDASRDAVLASIRENYAGPVDFAADGMRLSP